MATQEEKNKGMSHLLRLATDLLVADDHLDINFIEAQNLIRQCLFKYMDLADCPFRDTCYNSFADDYEPEAPYNWREDRD